MLRKKLRDRVTSITKRMVRSTRVGVPVLAALCSSASEAPGMVRSSISIVRSRIDRAAIICTSARSCGFAIGPQFLLANATRLRAGASKGRRWRHRCRSEACWSSLARVDWGVGYCVQWRIKR